MGIVGLYIWPPCYATAAKSLQSCPTLCDPIDGSPPGSPIPGILQARTLEWFAISFSNAWKWKVKVKSLSRVRLLATPWTVAYQAPPSMGFSRQEYWRGCHGLLLVIYDTNYAGHSKLSSVDIFQVYQLGVELGAWGTSHDIQYSTFNTQHSKTGPALTEGVWLWL